MRLPRTAPLSGAGVRLHPRRTSLLTLCPPDGKISEIVFYRGAITECLGTERLDLVDLRRASPVLRFEILRTGQLLYAADQALSERFELATLRVYRDTAWLRRQQRAYLRERMELCSSGEKP